MRSIIVATMLATLATAPAHALSPASPDTPADVSVDQVKAALAAAKPDHPADFAGKSLKNLDLSEMDLSGANLKGANLFGAKLAHAKLEHADLTGANLNLSWLIGADFTGANLTDASLVAPVVAQGLVAAAGYLVEDASGAGQHLGIAVVLRALLQRRPLGRGGITKNLHVLLAISDWLLAVSFFGC